MPSTIMLIVFIMSRKLQHIINMLAFNDGRTSGREGKAEQSFIYFSPSLPREPVSRLHLAERTSPQFKFTLCESKNRKTLISFCALTRQIPDGRHFRLNTTRKANKWFVSIQVLETTLLHVSNSRTLKKAVVTCDVFNNDSNLRAVYQGTNKTTDFKTSR